MVFAFFQFRFHFLAKDSVYFPPGKLGNVVRGAFGTIFRRIACVPGCPGARDCEIRESCPYARIFEPQAACRGGFETFETHPPAGDMVTDAAAHCSRFQTRPSGLADWPRPFLFRAWHLDGRVIHAGETFWFDVHVFDVRDPALPYFVLTFAQLAREGLGPRRGRTELVSVEQLNLDGSAKARAFDGQSFLLYQPLSPSRIELNGAAGEVRRLRVRFLTPTELKSGQQVTSRPEFAALFGRIRDRISTLRALYGPGPLEIDFKAMGERAARVKMTRCELRRTFSERHSRSTGRVHPLGGFVGEAEYEGDLGEFVPYLQAAKWTGVGRQTVWGKGEVEVSSEQLGAGSWELVGA